MRLQKQLSRKVGDKIYDKFVITIPPQKIRELGWFEGLDLEGDVKGDQLVVRPKKDKFPERPERKLEKTKKKTEEKKEEPMDLIDEYSKQFGL